MLSAINYVFIFLTLFPENNLLYLTLTNTLVFADLAGYHINHYQVIMDLSEDGSMEVREDIGVIFTESRRGIYRTIPIYSPS